MRPQQGPERRPIGVDLGEDNLCRRGCSTSFENGHADDTRYLHLMSISASNHDTWFRQHLLLSTSNRWRLA